jgi:murein DD-endopeptidase MepM/ murein hydrolase activator NlpD/Zn-dependent protease with chaperone function
MFWLVHVVSSLIVAGLAFGIGARLHTRLQLSHAARGYWLGVWTLATLPPLFVTILLACMPETVATLPLALPLPIAIDPGTSAQLMASEVLPRQHAWPSLAAVLAGVYALGLGIAVLRWLRGSAVIAGIVRNTHSVNAANWPGPACAAEAARLTRRGIAVRITTRRMSPFAVRWPSPTIVLPADALAQLDDAGLRLVIRHEAAHLALRDPQRALLMSAVGTLLWFNPFVRAIAARVQMACELRCDAHALDGDVDAGRTFASAYLHTLRSYASMDAPAVALNHRDLAGHALRIRHMLNQDISLKLPSRWRIGLAGLGVAAVGLLSLLQMALAAPAGVRASASHPAPQTASRGATQTSIASIAKSPFRLASPLDTPKITGRFGEIGSARSRPHRGTDFGARVGTQVLAPAAGVVTAATTRYPEGPNYGTVVVLDHGNGWQTLYAHLDTFEVRVGQRVLAGERIAKVGRSGRVTGPHLHLEALFNGQRVDPERLLQ